MPKRLKTPEGGQRKTPDLSGAMNATRRLVEAMGSSSLSPENVAARGGEGSSGPFGGPLTNPPNSPPNSHVDNSTAHPAVPRYVNADGKIGVIVGKGPKGGWSSQIWLQLDPTVPPVLKKARKLEEIALFDKNVVTLVLNGHVREAKKLAIEAMGLLDHSFADMVELKVEWVDPGEEFCVEFGREIEWLRKKSTICFWRP